MNFDSNSMEYVGPVQVETKQGFVFCAIPTSWRPAALLTTLDEKAEALGADAVINVLAETEAGHFLGFYCWREVRLSGVAIRFKSSAKPPPSGLLPQ
ncbi:hypothetical protein ACFL2T_01750 [Elusimicrobiota bacterium]